MNLGVFLPNWVGDVVMATPALRALRRQFPTAHLIGILRPHLADVLAGTEWLDEQLWFDPRGDDPALRGLRFLRRLRAARLDTALLLTNSFRTALWAWASGAPRRIGYVRGGRGFLLTGKLRQRRERGAWVATPVLDDYLRLAHALGCPTESPRLELALVPAERLAAGAVWAKFGLGAAGGVVTLNSSGAFGSAKLWPEEYFAELARRIAERRGLDVLVLCGPSERTIARKIATLAAHPRIVSLADEPLSLGLTKACVAQSALLVTTDSGPRHFAAAFDVPVVTLFGPTHIAWSETHYPRAMHLQRQVPCGPCQQRTCPLGHHRCMRELTVDEVWRAVERQLDESWQVRAA